MSLLRNSIFTIMAVALTLASCNRQTIYSHYESISTEGWERGDYKDFCIAVREDGTYTETIGLRSTRVYPFTNISVIVSQQAQLSGVQRVDTLNITLTGEDGNEMSQGINYRQMDVPLATIGLQAGDSVHVSIRHYMAKEVLPGITDIGFSMKKTDK